MEFNITLTEKAKAAFEEIIDPSKETPNLRIWISGGGCSGLNYGLALDENEPEIDDIIVYSMGIKIVVDEFSKQYLNNAEIDWDENNMMGGFKINNPNSVNSCGCGQSFSTDNSEESPGCGGCSLK